VGADSDREKGLLEELTKTLPPAGSPNAEGPTSISISKPPIRRPVTLAAPVIEILDIVAAGPIIEESIARGVIAQL
jgi:hypothetical protein